MPTLILAAALWALLATPAALPVAEDFAVRFDRPLAAGAEMRVTETLTNSSTASVSGIDMPAPPEQLVVLRLDAAVKVLEVGPKGTPRHATVTVRQLTREDRGTTTELLAPGMTVDAHLENGKKVFSLDGKPVDGDAKAVLAGAGIVTAEGPTDDEIMGSGQRRRIGDSWPVKTEAVARLLGDTFPVRPESFSGMVTLAAKAEIRHIPCLEYHAKIEGKDFRFPADGLPAGFEAGQANLVATLSELVPLDLAAPVPSVDYSLNLQVAFPGTLAGKKVTMTLDMRVKSHAETLPLIPSPSS
jgi:hypothetical protein